MGNFKEREKTRREETILAVAKALFAEKGFDNVPLEEIAEQVGIAKGTIYRHFSRKEDLLLAILSEKQAVILTALDEAQRAGTPAAVFAKSTEAIFKLWDEDVDFLAIMETIIFHLVRMGEKPGSHPILERVEDVIRSAQAAGIVSPSLDPSLAAFSLLKPIPFFFARYLIREKGLSPAALKANLCQISLHGISNERSRIRG